MEDACEQVAHLHCGEFALLELEIDLAHLIGESLHALNDASSWRLQLVAYVDVGAIVAQLGDV